MKASISGLNPDAKSYVPVSRREESSNQPDSIVSHERALENSPQGNASFSDQLRKMKSSDEEELRKEMSLAYLQMSFPDVSEQSLIAVYDVNEGDLNAAVDMLCELESVEKPDYLPDALDIGDVPEIFPSGESSAAQTNNVAGDSSSSSGISHLAILS